MAQLHTVIVYPHASVNVKTRQPVTLYECEFAGIRFSRTDIDVLRHWVRVAGVHVHGAETQIIFLLEERS